jgi:hypothetical protein
MSLMHRHQSLQRNHPDLIEGQAPPKFWRTDYGTADMCHVLPLGAHLSTPCDSNGGMFVRRICSARTHTGCQ